MTNISIEVDQARHWMQDVKNELEQVDILLKRAAKAYTTPAGEDDVIMKGIENTCNALDTFWTGMCNGFKEACDFLGGAIEKVAESATEVVEDITAVRGRIGT